MLVLIGCTGPQHTAGTTDEDAPLGSEVIIVSLDGSRSDAYRAAGNALQDAGFQVESSDSELGSITTAPRSDGDMLGPVRDMVISASVREGPVVHLQGRYANDTPISKHGQSGSPARKAWAALHLVAEDMGDVVGYE